MCHIGTDTTARDRPGQRRRRGIEISSSDNYVGFGVLGPPVGNVISGNGGNNVYFLGAAGNPVSGNHVVANKIGTNLAGTAVLGNGFHGVTIGFGTSGNFIGAAGGGTQHHCR